MGAGLTAWWKDCCQSHCHQASQKLEHFLSRSSRVRSFLRGKVVHTLGMVLKELHPPGMCCSMLSLVTRQE